MTDQLITFETAKLAKEKGFQEEVHSYYRSKDSLYNIFPEYEQGSDNWNGNDFVNCWSAPTQSLLQKWLREKHSIFVIINLSASSGYFFLKIIEPDEMITSGLNERLHTLFGNDIKYYEDALERGLQEGLKLIK